jgi:DNA-binding transcriptional LysR family regulator
MHMVHDPPAAAPPPPGRPGGLQDLNLFRVFDAVFRERSLTRAGRQLALSQSAVSHALARLREQLGDPLFVREGAGVAPTPVAARLAPGVREALGLLQQAAERTRAFTPGREAGLVTLAMHDEVEPSLLPPVVAALRAAAPGVQVASVRLVREQLAADLAAGRVDAAVDVARPVSAELLHAPLSEDAFCVVSARRRRLTPERYLAARHVTVSTRPAGRSVEDVLLGQLGHRREVVVRCQRYASACALVAGSDLLLTMPRRAARALNAPLGNHVLPLPIPLPPVALHLYWHRQVDADPRSRWLREAVLRAAAR